MGTRSSSPCSLLASVVPLKTEPGGLRSLVPLAAMTGEMLRKVHLYLIKPTQYDDDGYVVRHWRGVLPEMVETVHAACAAADATGETRPKAATIDAITPRVSNSDRSKSVVDCG